MRVSSISPCIPSVSCRNPMEKSQCPIDDIPWRTVSLNSPGNCDTGSSRLKVGKDHRPKSWISPSKNVKLLPPWGISPSKRWQFSGSNGYRPVMEGWDKRTIEATPDVLKKKGLEATELGFYQQEIGIKAIRMLIEPEKVMVFGSQT